MYVTNDATTTAAADVADTTAMEEEKHWLQSLSSIIYHFHRHMPLV